MTTERGEESGEKPQEEQFIYILDHKLFEAL